MNPMMVTKQQWKSLFDAAYVAQIHIGIHENIVGDVDTHDHAEAALREWAREHGMASRLVEHEYSGRGLGGWVNLEVRWGAFDEPQAGNGVIIYRIRELVPAVEQVDEPEVVEEPDSNATLGLSQEFSR
jgi:hypothetical protein